MRILKVTQSYAPFFEFGGPPVKVRALAEGLARRGHQVTVLTADWGLERRLQQWASSASDRDQKDLAGVKAQITPFGRRWAANGVTAEYLRNWLHYRALSWNPALGRYLRARLNEFDVVHIYGLYDLLGPRVAEQSRNSGLPYVVEPIGMYVPIVRNIWLKKIYHRVWGRKLLQGATAIVATAEQERDELVAGGLDPSNIVIRRNGVEAPKQLPQRGEFRRRLAIAENAPLILFLGRLSQKKSPDLLLRAFANLPGEASAQLAFVGPDASGMRAKLQELARATGVAQSVHFIGPLDGQAKWAAYQDADVFVLPSQNENFGNTAAEAVAAGTPVVVTDRCGIAPFLKDVAGLVVTHDDKPLAGALTQLLRDQNLYARLRDGCAKATAALGWDEPVHQMEVIYRRLVQRRPS